jgi:large subunit ribosomal protein L5
MQARLHEKYTKDVTPGLVSRFGYTNPMSVPKLSKIVVSMGIGDANTNQARLEMGVKHLALITGQQPVTVKAKKSISNFKLREGYPVGVKVTLRGKRMWEFLDRLISLAVPRVKDFRGLSASGFDGHGNYNMGLVEQSVFPEIDPATLTSTQGMNIAMQTTARTDEEARELLGGLGMPFRKN